MNGHESENSVILASANILSPGKGRTGNYHLLDAGLRQHDVLILASLLFLIL
jgi:hypothetical protein